MVKTIRVVDNSTKESIGRLLPGDFLRLPVAGEIIGFVDAHLKVVNVIHGHDEDILLVDFIEKA